MTGVEVKDRAWPEDKPELLPLLPIVAAAWTDGLLTPGELDALRERIGSLSALDEAEQIELAEWLDDDSAPDPGALVGLTRRIRRAALTDEVAATASLTSLGIAIWEATGEEGAWSDPDAQAELTALEASLELLGAEEARRLRGVQAPSRTTPTGPTFDPNELRDYLDGDRRPLRDRVLELMARPDIGFEPDPDSSVYREQVLGALRVLAEEGLGSLAYPTRHGGANDPGGSVAVFETLAFGDLSVLVKFGVQFGLFGGSVHQLGTERHHETYLPRIASLELPGCYAMTETGHGSNVRDLETTATYDHERGTLVVHTPSEGAGKDWIGNAAAHGQLATVFARLIVRGEDHGVHTVLVPVRSDDGAVAEGVRIEDRGPKVGLNGVDNGRVWFDHVEVPVDNLLDRFATIDEDGRYCSPIRSSGRRFFTMLRTLVAGRVSIAAASVSASKTALTIAARYTAQRLQFGPDGGAERPLLGYLALQRELVPRLATTLGLHFAVRDLQGRYDRMDAADVESSDREDAGDVELEVRAAALKAYASDHCVETVQACREACGGQGYLASNRFAALRADTDIFTTFEGANLVLYQLAAKGLLSRFREQMDGFGLRQALKYLGERAEVSLTELNPIVTRRTDPEHLMDPEFHQAAFEYREERVLRSLALRMRARLRDGVDSFDAINDVQDHLVAVAKAHAERLILERFHEGCAGAPNPGTSEFLHSVSALFALSRIEADRGWFLEAGYIEGGKSRAIRSRVNELCRELAASAPDLVAAFGIPDHLLPPIAHADPAK